MGKRGPKPKSAKLKKDFEVKVFGLKNHCKLTDEQTAEALGVSRQTIATVKRRESYNRLAQIALEDSGAGIEHWCEKIVDLGRSKKDQVKLSATELALDVFGAKAPKEVDITHRFNALTDDELTMELENAIEGHKITCPQLTESVDFNGLDEKQRSMAEVEQGAGAGDSRTQ